MHRLLRVRNPYQRVGAFDQLLHLADRENSRRSLDESTFLLVRVLDDDRTPEEGIPRGMVVTNLL